VLDEGVGCGVPVLGSGVGLLEDHLRLRRRIGAADGVLLGEQLGGAAGDAAVLGLGFRHAGVVPPALVAVPNSRSTAVGRRTVAAMGSKIPPKGNEKKVGKSLKEKRAAKQAKKAK
jgi:hypothetical protein